MSLTVLAYAGTAALHGSGFAAVYVAALVLGNAELPHRAATRSFSEGVAWLAQIGLFVMLGLLVTPDEIDAAAVVTAVVAGLALALLARPISILVASVAQPMPPRELAFLSWAGLRGAVPIVLATIPLAEHVVGSRQLFNIVFVLVVIDTLVTAPTLPWVAKVLKVARRSEPRDLEVEAAPLERIAADLLQVTISPKSLMHGVEVGELRLPAGSSVALIVRDGRSMVPERRTVLRRGDEILVVTPRKDRVATEQRLRAVSVGGRLAQWLGRKAPSSVDLDAGLHRLGQADLLRCLPVQAPEPVADEHVDSRPEVGLVDLHAGAPAEGEGDQLGGRVVGLGRPDDGAAHGRGALRCVACVARLEPCLLDLLQGLPGQALASAGVEDADLDLAALEELLDLLLTLRARRVRRTRCRAAERART